MLIAVDHLARGPREIVIAGAAEDPKTRALLTCVRQRFLPGKVVALARPGADSSLIPLLAGRIPAVGESRAFVCRNYACELPSSDAEALARRLES